MPGAPAAVIPIRSFAGMSRLAGVLPVARRIDLSRTLAERVADAIVEAGCEMLVVTSDDDVTRWASKRATVVPDPGIGLDGAAAAGVARCPAQWIVIHADLPLIDTEALGLLLTLPDDGRLALVPSPDGGTTAIAGSGAFPFSFGPGSFHRHLARAPDARIVTDARLSVDLDTPAQWLALRPNLGIA